jgi:hypothetical protein
MDFVLTIYLFIVLLIHSSHFLLNFTRLDEFFNFLYYGLHITITLYITLLFHKTITIPVPVLYLFSYSSFPLCKNPTMAQTSI